MPNINTHISEEQQLAFANLHDAFMNASLQHSLMLRQGATSLQESRASNDPAFAYSTSDYGRLERCWVAFLYVLVEAWVHPDTEETVKLIGSFVSLRRVEAALAASGWSAGKRLKDLTDCPLAQMRETRHYMAHRDQREYWDSGRTGPVGILTFTNELHNAFSEMFLNAIDEMRRREWKPQSA